MLGDIEPALDAMGELAGGELYRLQLADRLNEPVLTQWSAWGERIDRVEVSPLWRRAERIAAEQGVVACAYDTQHGAHARLHQFALAYLFTPSTDFYSCPLAMTDGAARALLASGNEELIARAVPRLTSRDPVQFWTSGQWMTEAAGGSDVGASQTIARREQGVWRLYGRKWFTSAVTAQMALTLARPEGNPPGGKGLALFYLETRDAHGNLNGITINRLKDKLGTRKVPTAELELAGACAEPVKGLSDGVKQIAPMLNVTRTWNSMTACALMRRGLALARDYAGRRVVFGARLSEQPLHADTLAGLQAEFEGAMQLTFFTVQLLGQAEAGAAGEARTRLLRLLTPVAKLTTGRQVVAVLSEIIESFGGAGYVEDTGLPLLLRDAQVLPIWEGTTNVLALDVLRSLREIGGLGVLRQELADIRRDISDAGLTRIFVRAEQSIAHAERWLKEAAAAGDAHVQAGARRFSMTLGRTLAVALLARHAQWALQHGRSRRSLAAACRFAAHPFDLLADMEIADAHLLSTGEGQ